jgi:hypothetical protein
VKLRPRAARSGPQPIRAGRSRFVGFCFFWFIAGFGLSVISSDFLVLDGSVFHEFF